MLDLDDKRKREKTIIEKINRTSIHVQKNKNAMIWDIFLGQ